MKAGKIQKEERRGFSQSIGCSHSAIKMESEQQQRKDLEWSGDQQLRTVEAERRWLAE